MKVDSSVTTHNKVNLVLCSGNNLLSPYGSILQTASVLSNYNDSWPVTVITG